MLLKPPQFLQATQRTPFQKESLRNKWGNMEENQGLLPFQRGCCPGKAEESDRSGVHLEGWSQSLPSFTGLRWKLVFSPRIIHLHLIFDRHVLHQAPVKRQGRNTQIQVLRVHYVVWFFCNVSTCASRFKYISFYIDNICRLIWSARNKCRPLMCSIFPADGLMPHLFPPLVRFVCGYF